MKIVLQRVKSAKVEVENKIVGQIGRGYLVFLGVGESDTKKEALYLADKIVNLSIMPDQSDKMNLTLKKYSNSHATVCDNYCKAGILVISQFTLYGDTKGQNRPSFTGAAPPDKAKKLYDIFIDELVKQDIYVQTGIFGAKMAVSLVNDGPVTLILET